MSLRFLILLVVPVVVLVAYFLQDEPMIHETGAYKSLNYRVPDSAFWLYTFSSEEKITDSSCHNGGGRALVLPESDNHRVKVLGTPDLNMHAIELRGDGIYPNEKLFILSYKGTEWGYTDKYCAWSLEIID